MEEERVYTVYMHICLENDKKYIGITKRSPKVRWNSGRGYVGSKFFYSAIKKYGWENFKHEIILCNLTKEEANMFEIELIKYYKTTNRMYGYNIESGGINAKTASGKNHYLFGKHLSEETKLKLSKANKGRKVSEEHRKKLSEAFRGEKHPMYGKHHTEKAKKKIGDAHRGEKSWIYGKTHTLEARIKISQMTTGKKKKRTQEQRDANILRPKKSVINLCTGEIFLSAVDAHAQIGVNASSIGNVCNGRDKTAGGYLWAFLDKDGTILYPKYIGRKK